MYVSLEHPLFRLDSGMNQIKQKENVKDRPSGSVAQLLQSACSVSESPGWATIFSFPVTSAC